ncbi:MAG: hypothetical protein QN198_10545 [Armatimonadota bacterium]|nr:hypothetical protein [Armatimonadota bacterium]MDR5704021.1 hypothetical protein [Armatimonadota bacterium]MDR7433686.1 hypothetical protein [Armatimonadota bacterium]
MRDVLGYPLEEAKVALEEEGIAIDRIVEILPRRRVELSGRLRVVRQRESGPRRVELVVTREQYVERRTKGSPPAGESPQNG